MLHNKQIRSFIICSPGSLQHPEGNTEESRDIGHDHARTRRSRPHMETVIPMTRHTTDITAEFIMTLLNVLHTLMDVRAEKNDQA